MLQVALPAARIEQKISVVYEWSITNDLGINYHAKRHNPGVQVRRPVEVIELDQPTPTM